MCRDPGGEGGGVVPLGQLLFVLIAVYVPRLNISFSQMFAVIEL